MPEWDGGQIRRLRSEDIPAAFELSAEAGWNQTREDWQLLLQLAPEGCVAIEADGQVISTATLISYGCRLAWIGMVLTKKRYQRRGLARRLLARLLDQADQMGIATTKLDATEQGMQLYEKFGFRVEQPVERWSRPGDGATQIPNILSTSKESWRETDAITFGADRSRLLEELSQRHPPLVQARSYLFARAGRLTAYLGPCVGESPGTVRCLIDQLLQNSSSAWSWDLFPRNLEAVSLARAFGFSPQRHLLRMVRGQALQQNENEIYSIAGFELG